MRRDNKRQNVGDKMDDGNGGNVFTELIKTGMDYLSYVWMVTLALWGGTVAYLTKLKKDDEKFRVVEYVARMVTSGFAGLLAGYIGLAMLNNPLYAFILAGMGGHAGAGTLVLIEKWGRKSNLPIFGNDNDKDGIK